jgi:hypothetical protein
MMPTPSAQLDAQLPGQPADQAIRRLACRGVGGAGGRRARAAGREQAQRDEGDDAMVDRVLPGAHIARLTRRGCDLSQTASNSPSRSSPRSGPRSPERGGYARSVMARPTTPC